MVPRRMSYLSVVVSSWTVCGLHTYTHTHFCLFLSRERSCSDSPSRPSLDIWFCKQFSRFFLISTKCEGPSIHPFIYPSTFTKSSVSPVLSQPLIRASNSFLAFSSDCQEETTNMHTCSVDPNANIHLRLTNQVHPQGIEIHTHIWEDGDDNNNRRHHQSLPPHFFGIEKAC